MGVNERRKARRKTDQKLRKILSKLIDYFREWEITDVKFRIPGFLEVTLNKKKKQLAGVY